jgi:hypothetical protein
MFCPPNITGKQIVLQTLISKGAGKICQQVMNELFFVLLGRGAGAITGLIPGVQPYKVLFAPLSFYLD